MLEEQKGSTKAQAKSDKKEEPTWIFESSEDLQVVPSFEGMGLRSELLKGIYAYGFEKPSAVQQRAILPILQGRDVIVQSQSGTGKTCVFCVGALQMLDLNVREPQALILSPTRELAEQNQKVCMALGDAMNVSVGTLLTLTQNRFIAALVVEVSEKTS